MYHRDLGTTHVYMLMCFKGKASSSDDSVFVFMSLPFPIFVYIVFTKKHFTFFFHYWYSPLISPHQLWNESHILTILIVKNVSSGCVFSLEILDWIMFTLCQNHHLNISIVWSYLFLHVSSLGRIHLMFVFVFHNWDPSASLLVFFAFSELSPGSTNPSCGLVNRTKGHTQDVA